MRNRLVVLLYLSLFWLLFHVVIRALFLLYNIDLSHQLTAGEIVRVFLNGLRMDASMTGYFIMAAGLLLTVSLFVRQRWPYFMLNALQTFLVIACSLIAIVDMELYRHWGFRLNSAPLFYVESAGAAALGSVALVVVLKLLMIGAALVTVFLFLYDRIISSKIASLQDGSPRAALVLLITTALMIIPIRGSFTVAPMNTGFVYFHKTKPYANHAAINVVWNFLYFLRKGTSPKYPNSLIPAGIAGQYFRELYPRADSTTAHLWTAARPNIILIILESFTADVVESLGGMAGVAPNLSALSRQGVLFTNFYASGDRTDKGLISILSGYPAQPLTSIIKDPSKTQRLPYLNHYMLGLGYHTSFVYGGDIDFANFRSYLTNSRFDHITSMEDFPSELNHSKWGVHDHIVFQRALQECDTTRQPFFKVMLSLSSHEPFDVPMVAKFPGHDIEHLFLNSCYYTDQCIGDFIVKAKASSWWNNTVIIFVADHGHPLPGHKPLQSRQRYRIPLIMVGGAVKTDTLIEKFGGQTDIANTLLGQLSHPSASFTFSKNLLSPSSRSFATYFFNDGFGFVTPDQYIVYDNVGKEFIEKDGAGPKDLERSKSYEQILFTDYNNK
jgi:phosphoglycerol transferase MdoB-like AlkP superfamily enzyme